MTLDPRCPFLYWFLPLLVTRCAEPSALVCPSPALSPSQPPRRVSRPASPRPVAPFAPRLLPLAAHPKVGK